MQENRNIPIGLIEKVKSLKMKANRTNGLGRRMKILALHCALIATAAVAGPAAKLDPVCAEYPAWEGVTMKNYIAGRVITPSDLRQRVTIVVEFQMEKLGEQLPKFGGWANVPKAGESPAAEFDIDWMTKDVHENAILLLCNRGESRPKKDPETFAEGLKKLAKNASLGAAALPSIPVYSGVTFAGAPDAGGKYPYVYVMGFEGKEPVLKCPIADLKKGELNQAVIKAKKDAPTFRKFYGLVSEPQFFKTFGATIAKGKTLVPLQKSLLAKVKSGNIEEAKEAQKLYDGLEQTKSDLLMKIALEGPKSPHIALYDCNTLGKYWPAAKKDVVDIAARYSKNAQIAGIAAIVTKVLDMDSPDFHPKKGQVKAIKAQLAKYRKQLAPLKESQNITIQNAALMVDAKIEELEGTIESKAE